MAPPAVETGARQAIDRCRMLARCSDDSEFTTRTFLSAPMRAVHAHVTQWMQAAGMDVSLDHAGNIRGVYAGAAASAPRFVIGSHLDTVPRAGAFDGVLGVMLGIALVDSLDGRRLPFTIEVVGFSEEEGVRFGVPFIGSRALAARIDHDLLDQRDSQGVSVAEAIRAYGLDPDRLGECVLPADAIGYLEFHIEQGPVLDGLRLPLGVVDAIVGQSRLVLTFTGAANHAGTTPMTARRDAVAAAAEWIVSVERDAHATPGLVATVGRVEASPGAGNVIAGRCTATLDVRHASDTVRATAVKLALYRAHTIATCRGIVLSCETRLDQGATPMDPRLTGLIERAIADSGETVYRLPSGAGHDAMIVAQRMPVAMLFLRSPGGISHHPDETVHNADVAAALTAGERFLDLLAAEHA